jgi:hypothetical protein
MASPELKPASNILGLAADRLVITLGVPAEDVISGKPVENWVVSRVMFHNVRYPCRLPD